MGYIGNSPTDVLQLAVTCPKSRLILLAGASAVECRHMVLAMLPGLGL